MISDSFMHAAEFIGIAFGGMIFYAVKRIAELRKRSCGVTKCINQNSQIFENLVALRATLDCDRVKMFQFFNGDYYTTGQSTLKMHMTYCTVKTGVSLPQGFIYGEAVPVSRVSHVIKPLVDDSHCLVYTSDMDENEWRAANVLNGTVLSLFIRIGHAGSLQGIIVCSYTRIDDVKDHHIAIAHETASAISAIL